MSGVAIEDLLEPAELRKAKAKLGWLIGHPSVSAAAFLDTLLGPERRKTGWMRAEAAGDVAPGVSRRYWGAVTGMPTRCATLCATIRSRRWPRATPCW